MDHGMSIHDSTRELVESVQSDRPMTPSTRAEFGIQSQEHFEALGDVLTGRGQTGAPAAEAEAGSVIDTRLMLLDDARENGPRLNALVKLYAPNYGDSVKFETRWDRQAGRTGTEATRLQAVAEGFYRNNRLVPYEIPEKVKPLLELMRDPNDLPWLSETRDELLSQHFEYTAENGGTLEIQPMRENPDGEKPHQPPWVPCAAKDAQEWSVSLHIEDDLTVGVAGFPTQKEAQNFVKCYQKAYPHLGVAGRYLAERTNRKPGYLTQLVKRYAARQQQPEQKRAQGQRQER